MQALTSMKVWMVTLPGPDGDDDARRPVQFPSPKRRG
jgi:hypothetical protein